MMYRILIIDDEPESRKRLEDSLTSPDFKLSFASSGIEGLDLAKAENPHLVICNYDIPGLQSRALCEAFLYVRSCGLKFIFLTEKEPHYDIVKLMNLAKNEFIMTPFYPEDLIEIVSSRLRKRDALLNGLHAA